jgi:hypothetical protein
MQPALQAVLWSPPTASWLLLYQKFVPPTLFRPKTDYIYDHRILHKNRSDSMKIGAEMLSVSPTVAPLPPSINIISFVTMMKM